MMITHVIHFLTNIIILYNTATLLDDKIFKKHPLYVLLYFMMHGRIFPSDMIGI